MIVKVWANAQASGGWVNLEWDIPVGSEFYIDYAGEGFAYREKFISHGSREVRLRQQDDQPSIVASERRYTAEEIDRLRAAVQKRGGIYIADDFSRPAIMTEYLKQIEDRVRTHMLAGHTAEDLLASEPSPEGVWRGADGDVLPGGY